MSLPLAPPAKPQATPSFPCISLTTASLIACLATSSLLAGKRGFSRPFASILWPVNRRMRRPFAAACSPPPALFQTADDLDGFRKVGFHQAELLVNQELLADGIKVEIGNVFDCVSICGGNSLRPLRGDAKQIGVADLRPHVSLVVSLETIPCCFERKVHCSGELLRLLLVRRELERRFLIRFKWLAPHFRQRCTQLNHDRQHRQRVQSRIIMVEVFVESPAVVLV